MRDCAACARPITPGEPDPCLGYLPGVQYACCGHGERSGYILFETGVTLRFKKDVVIEQLIRPRGMTVAGWRVKDSPWIKHVEPPRHPFAA